MIRIRRKQAISDDFLRAFQKLMTIGLGFRSNIALAKAWRGIQVEQEAFQKATLAQLQKYGATQVPDGWKFATIEQRNAFQLEQAQADDEEIEIEIAKVRLPEKCDLTAADLAPLLELIDESSEPVRVHNNHPQRRGLIEA